MKDRILNNWTFMRVIYLVIGVFLVVQSILNAAWLGVIFGGYFAAMGLFAFGCASGNCYGGNCVVEPKQKSTIQEIDYEEMK